ncbi:MAG: family 16 glycosylhydrolase [Phycisphaerales bacterium]|nr:family 16 glycosylhydrolase [Phycisphaerales bacterium]
MTRRVPWLAAIVGVGGLSACAQGVAGRAGGEAERPGWRLVWGDEFEGAALDPAKWRVEDAALIKNNELQYYSPDEVYLEHGCLVLRSRERGMGGRSYTSGLVDTRHRFSQAFGRFEVRAQLPKGRGVWPAHWMLPEDHPAWPPELDIMELLGHEPDVVYQTQHWGVWPNNAHEGRPMRGPDFSEEFHTFAMEWSPERVDWFVDDRLQFSSTREVPTIPFYLILNTAVGGDWPGNPDATTVLPQYHRIEYVRVYAKEGAAPTLSLVHPNGSIALEPAGGLLRAGDEVTALAKPDFGFRFSGWEAPPEGSTIAGATIRFRADGPQTIVARFEPDPDLPELLSRGAPASASSSESADLGPANAVDGIMGTRWSSSFAVPQDLTIDLGAPARVELVRIRWENAHPAIFDLQASLDGEAWTLVQRVRKADASEDRLDGPLAPARYLRLHCTERATPWGVSVWEFEAFGHRVAEEPGER